MKFEAIMNLKPEAEFTLEGNVLIWKDENQTQPTGDEINTEMKRLENEYNSNEYARLRTNEYPPMEDQLDKIFHDGLDAWKEEIQTIKNKYPKGE
jgi:hypothetical protein